MTSSQKPLINLFIVGAAKSGTTSIYNYLKQHPDVFFPNVKEPNYYSDIESEDPLVYKLPKKGVEYHSKIINDAKVYFSLYNDSQSYKIKGDASPSYLYDNNAAQRINKDYPDAKIVIILRNPIIRTHSHYLMNIKSGVEKEEDFYKALLRDEVVEPKFWGSKALLYKELSLYSDQIRRYFKVFKKTNIKVFIYEEFFIDIKKSIEELLNFLDLDTEKISSINLDENHNTFVSPKNNFSKLLLRYRTKSSFLRSLMPKKIMAMIKGKVIYSKSEKPKISEEAESYLTSIFKEDIEKLEKLLNKDLSKWKQGL